MNHGRDLKHWLLIYAPPEGSILVFPLGIAFISAVLKEAGYRVTCLNMTGLNQGEQVARLTSVLRDSDIGVLGITGLSREYNNIKVMRDVAYGIAPDLISVIGGGIVSCDPLLVLDALQLNYGVLGEGEETVIELADAITKGGSGVDKINGLVIWGADGTPVKTGDRRGKRNIDDLPMPDYEGFDLVGYLNRQSPGSQGIFDTILDKPRIAPVTFSRSCPFPCTFCYHSVDKYRSRSMDSIFREIDYLIEHHNVNCLSIFDDLFAVKASRVHEFCAKIKERGLPWSCQLRFDSLDDELLSVMQDSGCWGISYGLESYSEAVLISMRKKLSPKQIDDGVRETYRKNIDVQGNYIFGDFAETYDTINETMRWWYDNPQYNIHLGPIDVYPGAQIYHRCLQQRLIQDPKEFLEKNCPRVNMTNIPDDELNEFHRACGLTQTIHQIGHIISAKFFSGADVNDVRTMVDLVCPHCGHVISYKNLPASNMPIVCKECYGRLRVPLRLHVGETCTPEHLPYVQAVFAALLAGNYQLAYTASMTLHEVNTPGALDFATMAALRGQLPTGGNVSVRQMAQMAVLASPHRAGAHVNMAAAYLLEGYIGWGLTHARQALLLDPHSAEAYTNLMRAKKAVVDEGSLKFIPRGQPIPLSELAIAIYDPLTRGSVPRHAPIKPDFISGGIPDHSMAAV